MLAIKFLIFMFAFSILLTRPLLCHIMKKIVIILLSFHLLSGSVCASQCIRVNLKGYLPDDVKVAIWLTDQSYHKFDGKNADYTVPDMKMYLSSADIYQNILNYEQINTLNGFMLLVHLVTDEKRTDKSYNYLDKLIET